MSLTKDIMKLRSELESLKGEKYDLLSFSDELLGEMERNEEMFRPEYIRFEKDLNSIHNNDYINLRKLLGSVDDLISNEVGRISDKDNTDSVEDYFSEGNLL